TAARTGAGITACDRRDVDPLPGRRFIEADSLEPTEERFPGAARERATAGALDLSRRLADEHHARPPGERDDRSHVVAVAAAAAGGQRSAVRLERAIEFAAARHPPIAPASAPNDSPNA